MIKISFNALWKIAVLILLCIIAIFTILIDNNLRSYLGTPYPVGCSASSTGTSTNLLRPTLLCAQPLTSQQSK